MDVRSRLLEAIANGDVNAVRGAVSRQPDVVSGGAEAAASPILAALYRGRDEVLRVLLEAADPDAFEAAALGDARRLRNRIASDPGVVARRSHDGWTPLHLAAFFGRREAVELLLEAGAPVEAESANEMANRPLHAALAGRTDPGVVEALLGAGADPAGTAGAGVTPLHLAASRGADDLLERLLDEGADPMSRMDDGATAADVAESRGHPGTAERLRARTAGGTRAGGEEEAGARGA